MSRPRSGTVIAPNLTPETLARAPELALLAILDSTLRIVALALLAAQPALVGDPPSWRVTPELLAARPVLRHARTLERAIDGYRRCVVRTLHDRHDAVPDDDLPF